MFDFNFKLPEEKYVIVEFLYPKFQISIINNNEYTILPNCTNFMEIINVLKRLNKKYNRLNLDVGLHYEIPICDLIKKYNLDYDIDRPTKKQIKDMNMHRLTLIGLYIYGRRLVRNDNIT